MVPTAIIIRNPRSHQQFLHPSIEKSRVVAILYSRDSNYKAYNYYIVAGETCWLNISAMSGTQRCWMSIVSSNKYISLNEYIFLWINIFSLSVYISLKVNNYIIFLKLNKYYSLNLHKHTVDGCKIMPWLQICFVECEYIFFEFSNKRPTLVNSGTNNQK